jgi:hypothetical protein
MRSTIRAGSYQWLVPPVRSGGWHPLTGSQTAVGARLGARAGDDDPGARAFRAVGAMMPRRFPAPEREATI